MAANYDTSSIKIDASQVHSNATGLEGLSKEVGSLIEQINGVTGKLKLGWVGKTSEEAAKFSDQWKKVMTDLFGTDDKNDKDESHAGVLNVIAGGAKRVADGFSQVELALKDSFVSLSDNLAKPPPTEVPKGKPDNIDTPDDSAIIEKW
ncbi:WXG100 family type VII secretion target [Pseudonocardia spinosispora]|uniref:WXG100 family type VII secretion target n=1 Tax=Pseudonocardia spinosispora TaxID=103441 RepID=UPI0012ECB16D|nr:WXG100 family type VII secretion target [Pseudonocardia spinosispora]